MVPEKLKLYALPADPLERNFKALRYRDNCLREFFSRLPKGTTVVMHGDPTASSHSDYSQTDAVNETRYVGCLICQKGNGLSP